MCRTVGIFRGPTHQPFLHGIHVNVLSEGPVFLNVPHSPIIITWLPDLPNESQFLLGSVRESALDQLQGPLQGLSGGDQEMEMIWHHHKLVQKIFFLEAVVLQKKYLLHEFVVMPDHFHLLIPPLRPWR